MLFNLAFLNVQDRLKSSTKLSKLSITFKHSIFMYMHLHRRYNSPDQISIDNSSVEHIEHKPVFLISICSTVTL